MENEAIKLFQLHIHPTSARSYKHSWSKAAQKTQTTMEDYTTLAPKNQL